MGVGMYPPLYMSDRTPSRILLKSDVQPRSQGLSSLTSRFDVSSEVITKCMYLVAKYRRHTDPDGRYDQNEIKRSSTSEASLLTAVSMGFFGRQRGVRPFVYTQSTGYQPPSQGFSLFVGGAPYKKGKALGTRATQTLFL